MRGGGKHNGKATNNKQSEQTGEICILVTRECCAEQRSHAGKTLKVCSVNGDFVTCHRMTGPPWETACEQRNNEGPEAGRRSPCGFKWHWAQQKRGRRKPVRVQEGLEATVTTVAFSLRMQDSHWGILRGGMDLIQLLQGSHRLLIGEEKQRGCCLPVRCRGPMNYLNNNSYYCLS